MLFKSSRIPIRGRGFFFWRETEKKNERMKKGGRGGRGNKRKANATQSGVGAIIQAL